MTDYEKTYETFWKPILEDEKGWLNMDQLKRELHDYRCFMEEVSKVYDQITGGRISKPNTSAEAVISEADAHYAKLHQND